MDTLDDSSSHRRRLQVSGIKPQYVALACCFVVLLLIVEFLEAEDFVRQSQGVKATKTEEVAVVERYFVSEFSLPKVVILPGPHKSGSTSLQSCMVDWTHNPQSDNPTREGSTEDSVVRDLVLSQWYWPAPRRSVLAEAGAKFVAPTKAFASLMGVADQDKGKLNMKKIIESNKSESWYQERIVEAFQTSMVDAWQQNYTIVFGSEEFDRISHPFKRRRDEVMDTILDTLPWESTIDKVESLTNATIPRLRPSLDVQDLEVVIAYRTPKIDFLRSLWNQLGQNDPRQDQSFRDFLACPIRDRFCFQTHPNVFDPLTLAQEFVKRNIRTTILDMAGIDAIANKNKKSTQEKTNVCHVVACNVLRDEPCTDNSKLVSLTETTANITDEHALGLVDISTKKFNHRKDTRSINLTNSQWDAIEDVLQEYDCGFRETLTSSPLFRILYKHNIFASCGDETIPRRPISWMTDRVESIARGDG